MAPDRKRRSRWLTSQVYYTNRTESSRRSRWHSTGKGGADGSLHTEEEEVDAARVVRADAQLATAMVHR